MRESRLPAGWHSSGLQTFPHLSPLSRPETFGFDRLRLPATISRTVAQRGVRVCSAYGERTPEDATLANEGIIRGFVRNPAAESDSAPWSVPSLCAEERLTDDPGE